MCGCFLYSFKIFFQGYLYVVRDNCYPDSLYFVVVQLLNCVQLFATPRPAARQASLSITNYQSLLKLTSMESVMPSNHLILCRLILCPLLLLTSIFPSIRVFSDESALHSRWQKYWSFIFSISPLCTITNKWNYIFPSPPSYSPHPVFKLRVELLMQENSNSEMWSSLRLKNWIIETFGWIFAQLLVGQPTILHWTCFLGRSTKVNIQKASVYTKTANCSANETVRKLG